MLNKLILIKRYKTSSGIEKAGILIGVMLIANNIDFLPSIAPLYYVFLILAFIFIYVKEYVECGSKAMIGLYLVCALSIIVNNVPTFFHPWGRLFTFILLTLLVSPTVQSNAFVEFRSSIVATILYLLQIVIFASFLYGITGGGYKHIYFQGITTHSMMIGPFAGMTIMYCTLKILSNQHNRTQIIFNSTLIICAAFCLLQAASRTAFIGTLISLLVMLSSFYRHSIGKYFKIVIILIIALSFTSPLWSGYLDKITQKNQGKETSLSVDSREDHWNQRISEFEKSPLFGIGFSSVDTSNLSVGSTFDVENGRVETGSSWLSILSMTGLFGFLIFLGIYMNALKKAWQMNTHSSLLSSLFTALLSFWLIHMVAEGYIFAGGNSLAFLVWLTIGTIYGISNDYEQIQQLQNQLIGSNEVHMD